jgi:hypothetical protein
MTRIDCIPSLTRYHNFIHDARAYYFDGFPKRSHVRPGFQPVSLLASEEEQVRAIRDLLRRESDGDLNFGCNGDLRCSPFPAVGANRALYLLVGQFT